jgi:hypothetical protein
LTFPEIPAKRNCLGQIKATSNIRTEAVIPLYLGQTKRYATINEGNRTVDGLLIIHIRELSRSPKARHARLGLTSQDKMITLKARCMSTNYWTQSLEV